MLSNWWAVLAFYVIMVVLSFYGMAKYCVPVFLKYKWDNSAAFGMVAICFLLAIIWPVAVVLAIGFFAAYFRVGEAD